MKFRQRLLLISLCLTICPAAFGRVWDTVTGQHFEAEFVRVEGGNGIFLVREKEYPYPLNRLSTADRLYIGRQPKQEAAAVTPGAAETPAQVDDASPPASAASAPAEGTNGTPQFAGQPLKLGGAIELDIPLLDPAALRETQHAYGKPSAKGRLLLAVPNDFDPAQSHPLLIVSATADGAASSIGTCRQYLSDALGKGFVVIAVDGEFGKPTAGDPPSFRWALIAAARDALEKEWPGAKKWPVATGGVSGGGGYASFAALKLLQERADVIGLFLAVSPHNPTKFSKGVSGVPVTELHNLPIFMSAGDKDETATPEITEESHRALVRAGFKMVRFEHFDGGHHLYKPHLQAALDWFLEGGGQPGGKTPPPRS